LLNLSNYLVFSLSSTNVIFGVTRVMDEVWY